LEIVKNFEDANNLKINYVIGPRRAGDIEKIYSNCDKVNRILGWRASKTTKEALISAWNWQKSKKNNEY